MEQETIVSTVAAVFKGADERNWEEIRNVMAAEVLLDYSSMSGGEPSIQTPVQITDAWAAFLPGFDKTRHHLSDFEVTIDGQTANVHYTGKAEHFIARDVWTVSGTYDTELTKVDGKWFITKHRLNLSEQSGNTSLPEKAIERINNKKSIIGKEKVQFVSDGLALSAYLFKPENFDESKEYPAILVGGSWTTVKEQMSGLYAEELSKRGFVTLEIDPRYFGESEGQPRFFENPADKVADYKNALTYLQSVKGVDANNLFLAAVCASAGYMATIAVQDKRVKGLATIAGWLHDTEAVKFIYGGEEGVEAKIKQARLAKRRFAETGEVEYIPSISTTNSTAAMFGDFDYYLNPERGGIPEWSADKFAVMSWEGWLAFNPMTVAKSVQVPTLMIHSDGAVLAVNVKRFFNDIPLDNKTLHWSEGTQFDFYDQPKQVTEAVAAIDVFFKNNIN